MPFLKVSNPEMITKSALVAEGFTTELYAYLVSLIPTPQSYAEEHSRFEASYSASLKGDPEKMKDCEADRNAVNQSLSILIGIAKAAAIKDPNVPKALGLANLMEKPAAPAASVSLEPSGFRTAFNRKGELIGTVSKVPGAKWYEIWSCDDDPNLETNWKLVASTSNCRGIRITGLNRSKTNWLKIRAMLKNVAGPWSHCLSLPPA
ncbi:hypothetical protein [Geomesophilobacter sediminis]|uniref:Uncharacterized protein n=1 Tax=Geomesophilobacter sediminis TaxID=2798584 RepID=A0A8J7JEY4_9BACT|nr:hypothetical protein [Geomesophilobacter sediminis]MBJ6726353.1 hypothetical protein [Geomesophilobacter sediminis]